MKRSTINAWVFYLGLPFAMGFVNGANQVRFGSSLPWLLSLVFWIPMVLVCWWFFHLCTVVAARILAPWSSPLWAKLALGIFIASLPLRYVVYIYIAAFDATFLPNVNPPPMVEFSLTKGFFLYYFKSWVALYLLWIGANLYFDRIVGFSRYRLAPRIPEDDERESGFRWGQGTSAIDGSPREDQVDRSRNVSVFLSRLPKSLGTDIKALQSEDHYIRVFTDMGDTLILFRLSDAIREMEVLGYEGLQVHRSFWVARSAVTGSKTDGRKTYLTLDTGDEIPVSQTYREIARHAGLLE